MQFQRCGDKIQRDRDLEERDAGYGPLGEMNSTSLIYRGSVKEETFLHQINNIELSIVGNV